MYLELFKLHELPFRLTPDPQFLYLSKHHARAKAYMESTIWFTDGFVVITGEIGAGKTTLIESFLKETEEIMDRVDPDKRIALFVDEWGSWYDSEEGTPGYGLSPQYSPAAAI